MNALDQVRGKAGFIIDMDGVIYHGNQLIPGVTEFIAWLEREKKKFLFLTNGSERSPRELQQKSAERSRIDIVTEQPMNGAALPQWADALESRLAEDGRSVTVYSSRPARTLFEIMKWLDQQGMQLEDVHLKRPTLEDVFVELTGKKLRD